MKKNSLLKDTVILTLTQFILETLGLLLNSFITRQLGEVSVGMISLVASFFSVASVFASGNIFVCASRFISEELAKPNGNPRKVFGYAVYFCMLSSLLVSSLVFIFAKRFFETEYLIAVRIMALSLPVSAICSCMKGYFNAYRKITVPTIADIIEFVIRSALTAFSTAYLIPAHKISVLSSMAFSIFAGSAISMIFLCICFPKADKTSDNSPSISFSTFFKLSLPILFNSYITVTLSGINDALVPVTLTRYSRSAETALSYYGIFEAIIIPVLFFPSSAVCCLGSLMIPEISKSRSKGDNNETSVFCKKIIRQVLAYSVVTAIVLAVFADKIGMLMSGDEFSGKVIRIMCPVIPFIYLEIILESIIKGLGRQVFSCFNYFVEYVIRISVLLISVPFCGFNGLILSYFASNIVGNTIRIFAIRKFLSTPDCLKCSCSYSECEKCKCTKEKLSFSR